MAWLNPINPVIPELFDSVFMQGGGAGSKFAARIFAEIIHDNPPKVYFGEAHRSTVARRLGFGVNRIDENAHPLFPGAMCVNSTAGFSSGLDFDALRTGFHRIVGLHSLDDKIGMPIEILVFHQCP